MEVDEHFVTRHLKPEGGQHSPHRDEQLEWTKHSCSRSLMPFMAGHKRDRVIVKRMTTNLARERQSVCVEEEDLDTFSSSPTDLDPECVCDHEGCRRFVTRKEDDNGGNCETVCGAASNAG